MFTIKCDQCRHFWKAKSITTIVCKKCGSTKCFSVNTIGTPTTSRKPRRYNYRRFKRVNTDAKNTNVQN